MRGVSILIILLLILGSSPLASARAVSEPTQRDVFLYEYFSQVLVRLDYSLRYALMNESYSLKLANLTLNELELIRDESLYYQERGVNSTVMRVIPPFYDFASETLILVQLVLEFHENPSPALASGILSTLEDMRRTLTVIEHTKLRNGTRVLVFNTAKIRKHLAEIRKLVSSTPPEQEGFFIGVSDDTPVLNKTVRIFGSCPGNSSVTIIIRGGNSTNLLLVRPSNGLFTTLYRFAEPGRYLIYAVQGKERSNSVMVMVRKIPTSFIVSDSYSAFLNDTIHLSGRLVDYYGRPLAGRRIIVGNVTLLTGKDGGFSRDYFSPVATSFRIVLRFEGDATHAGTSKAVTLSFTRYPVSITLDGPTEVIRGKGASFTGTVDPALPFPIIVYVAGGEYIRLTPDNGTFSFELRPNETGEFEVYAVFPGNERYEKARSNLIILKVVPPEDMRPRYVAIALLTLLMIGGFVLLRKRKGRDKASSRKKPRPEVVMEEENVPVVTDKKLEIPGDIGEAYTLLRRRLKEALGISESMTPREVLSFLRDWELYPYLETVTKLHEKAVYGEIPLSESETAEFIESMEILLGGVAA